MLDAFTQTEAKPYFNASSQSCRMSSCVASGLRSVWSIRAAIFAISGGAVTLSRSTKAIPTCSQRLRRQAEHANILQIAKPLGVVQSVSDNEFVWDGESDVIALHVLQAARGFIKQRRYAKCFGFALLQNAQQITDRESRVENVFDENHVESCDAAVEILQQPHLTGRFLSFSIARNSDEVDRCLETDFPHNVRKKNTRALEHANQMDALAAKILRDLAGHFAHALLDGRVTDQHFQLFALADAWPPHRAVVL